MGMRSGPWQAQGRAPALQLTELPIRMGKPSRGSPPQNAASYILHLAEATRRQIASERVLLMSDDDTTWFAAQPHHLASSRPTETSRASEASAAQDRPSDVAARRKTAAAAWELLSRCCVAWLGPEGGLAVRIAPQRTGEAAIDDAVDARQHGGDGGGDFEEDRLDFTTGQAEAAVWMASGVYLPPSPPPPPPQLVPDVRLAQSQWRPPVDMAAMQLQQMQAAAWQAMAMGHMAGWHGASAGMPPMGQLGHMLPLAPQAHQLQLHMAQLAAMQMLAAGQLQPWAWAQPQLQQHHQLEDGQPYQRQLYLSGTGSSEHDTTSVGWATAATAGQAQPQQRGWASQRLQQHQWS